MKNILQTTLSRHAKSKRRTIFIHYKFLFRQICTRTQMNFISCTAIKWLDVPALAPDWCGRCVLALCTQHWRNQWQNKTNANTRTFRPFMRRKCYKFVTSARPWSTFRKWFIFDAGRSVWNAYSLLLDVTGGVARQQRSAEFALRQWLKSHTEHRIQIVFGTGSTKWMACVHARQSFIASSSCRWRRCCAAWR